MTTMTIGTEKVGARIYITGNTFGVKNQLKSAGCHWDGDRKQWWIGTTKADAIQGIVSATDGAEAPKEDLSTRPCYGKCEYKGRQYFIIGRSEKTGKFWLTVLDCSIDFWAVMGDCRIVKTYQSRQTGYGKWAREEHQTIAGIRRFIERAKADRASGAELCAECGRPGDLVHDLEDGLLKHRGCCDIEP